MALLYYIGAYRRVMFPSMVARGVLDCASIVKMMHHDDRICVVVCRCIGHDCTMMSISGRKFLNAPDPCCPLMGRWCDDQCFAFVSILALLFDRSMFFCAVVP